MFPKNRALLYVIFTTTLKSVSNMPAFRLHCGLWERIERMKDLISLGEHHFHPGIEESDSF